MKVYELIAVLHELPAGADVFVNGCLDDNEYNDCEGIDFEIDEGNISWRIVRQTVTEVRKKNSKVVHLYF